MDKRNLNGCIFGRWKVLNLDHIKEYSKSNHYYWLCECECGAIKLVDADILLRGQSKSCGCWNKEMHKIVCANNFKKYNKFDLSKEYGVGYTSNTNKLFYFDLEDYDKIKDKCWSEGSHGYIMTCKKEDNTKKHITLHRLVMNAKENELIDHINRDRKDCRKENLRICSTTENSMNKTIQSNNTSGIIGVSWNKKSKKWRARITLNKKEKQLGMFTNKEDAIIARLKAEKECFKEFAPQKHLFEQYGI